jgi:hypothetical protein
MVIIGEMEASFAKLQNILTLPSSPLFFSLSCTTNIAKYSNFFFFNTVILSLSRLETRGQFHQHVYAKLLRAQIPKVQKRLTA